MVKKIFFDPSFLGIRILIVISIIMTFVQLFTAISLSCQLTLIQLIILPHWVASIYLEKIQLPTRTLETKAGTIVGVLTEIVSAVIFSITEIIRFLFPEFREPFFLEHRVSIPSDDTLVSMAFILGIVLVGLVMIVVSAFSGFLAALLPTRKWLSKLNSG